MSTVTNIILTFDICEDDEARMAEVNAYFAVESDRGFAKPIQCENPGEREVLNDYIGGSKNIEAPIYVGAFNGLGNDEFLEHIRTKVAWEYPKSVRCYREKQNEDAFEEVFRPAKESGEVAEDLIAMLDGFENDQWSGDAYHPEPTCPFCNAYPEQGHTRGCTPALLLRKYGRQVKIAEDK